jgi:hypothetical protein
VSLKGEAADIVDKAVDVLLTSGWCKGNVIDAAGRHCTMGALRRACLEEGQGVDVLNSHYFQAHGPFNVAVDAVKRQIRERYIASWNDHHWRTLDEVIEALRQASKELRNEATAA